VITWDVTGDGLVAVARSHAELISGGLAIVLDGVVQSAPVIKGRIGGGKGIIEGNFTADEAKDLALVLRSGALPAPLKIIDRYVVGPSLGADTIRKGMTSALVGTLAVLAYIGFYYRMSGLIADLALRWQLAGCGDKQSGRLFLSRHLDRDLQEHGQRLHLVAACGEQRLGEHADDDCGQLQYPVSGVCPDHEWRGLPEPRRRRHVERKNRAWQRHADCRRPFEFAGRIRCRK